MTDWIGISDTDFVCDVMVEQEAGVSHTLCKCLRVHLHIY